MLILYTLCVTNMILVVYQFKSHRDRDQKNISIKVREEDSLDQNSTQKLDYLLSRYNYKITIYEHINNDKKYSESNNQERVAYFMIILDDR